MESIIHDGYNESLELKYYCLSCQKHCASKAEHEKCIMESKEDLIGHNLEVQEVTKKVKDLLILNPQVLKVALSENEKSDLHQLFSIASQTALSIMSIQICESPVQKKKGSIRIASWNVTDFCSKFITNPYKIDLVCETIVRHHFDVVALQEVGLDNKDGEWKDSAAHKLKNKLHQSDPDADWILSYTRDLIGYIKEKTPVYGVFLHKTSTGIKLESEPHICKEDCYPRAPVYAVFKFKDWKFALINFHLSPTMTKAGKEKNGKQLEILHKQLIAYKKTEASSSQGTADTVSSTHAAPAVDEENEILLGDFNAYVDEEKTNLKDYKYENVFDSKEKTNTSKYKQSYDAIIAHTNLIEESKLKENDRHNVADIAVKGDIKQEDISTHKPIWADFKF